MSIRPVVLHGMMQNTQNVSQTKQNETNKPILQQQNMQTQLTKEINHQLQKVNNPDNADKQDYKFDAKEKGSNEYEGNRGKKKKKKDEKQLGTVVRKTTQSGFDMSV